jgi:hypothetical protein
MAAPLANQVCPRRRPGTSRAQAACTHAPAHHMRRAMLKITYAKTPAPKKKVYAAACSPARGARPRCHRLERPARAAGPRPCCRRLFFWRRRPPRARRACLKVPWGPGRARGAVAPRARRCRLDRQGRAYPPPLASSFWLLAPCLDARLLCRPRCRPLPLGLRGDASRARGGRPAPLPPTRTQPDEPTLRPGTRLPPAPLCDAAAAPPATAGPPLRRARECARAPGLWRLCARRRGSSLTARRSARGHDVPHHLQGSRRPMHQLCTTPHHLCPFYTAQCLAHGSSPEAALPPPPQARALRAPHAPRLAARRRARGACEHPGDATCPPFGPLARHPSTPSQGRPAGRGRPQAHAPRAARRGRAAAAPETPLPWARRSPPITQTHLPLAPAGAKYPDGTTPTALAPRAQNLTALPPR